MSKHFDFLQRAAEFCAKTLPRSIFVDTTFAGAGTFRTVYLSKYHRSSPLGVPHCLAAAMREFRIDERLKDGDCSEEVLDLLRDDVMGMLGLKLIVDDVVIKERTWSV